MTEVRDYRAILARLDDPYNSWSYGHSGQVAIVVSYAFTETAELPAPDTLPYEAETVLSFSEAQRAAVRQAMAVFEAETGVLFVETEGTAMINAFGVTGSAYGGWAHYPYVTDDATSTGDLTMDLTGGDRLSGARYQAILHELGHALGLSHPFSGSYTLADDLDTQAVTIMSYSHAVAPYGVLREMDKTALQQLYGGALDTTGWSYAFGQAGFTLTAGALDDALIGVRGRNDLRGMGGDDRLIGREAADILRGGAGNDDLDGGLGADTLYGGWGADRLFAGNAATWETDFAQSADALFGGGGGDLLLGNGYRNALHGGSGADRLRGGGQADRLWGDAGEDRLSGGAGADRVSGGRGNDILSGGAGRDVLTGGPGADTFVFCPSDGAARDRITDFTPGEDRLDLSALDLGHGAIVLQGRHGGLDTLLSFGDAAPLTILLKAVAPDDLNPGAEGDLIL